MIISIPALSIFSPETCKKDLSLTDVTKCFPSLKALFKIRNFFIVKLEDNDEYNLCTSHLIKDIISIGVKMWTYVMHWIDHIIIWNSFSRRM